MPPITDPDGDTFKLKLDLGRASVFTKLSNESNTTIEFNPSDSRLAGKVYEISIKLIDNNPYPKVKQYKLKVNVTMSELPGGGAS